MPTSSAAATWKGKIGDGIGEFKGQSGKISGAYSVPTRFGDEEGTNPEELIAAAHAACFAMQLSALLSEAGYDPNELNTTADVTVKKQEEGGWKITTSELTVRGHVPGIKEDEFKQLAEKAKDICPVSTVLNAEMTLDAMLAE
jgi:osmotically inducible protein OsmC